jgi:hypothetical protein
LVPLAVVGSVGLAASLMPTLAEAATAGHGTTVHSTTATLRPSAVPASKSAGMRTLHAPATTPHHLRQNAISAADTDPNPDLTVNFEGGGLSAFGVDVDATVTGYDTTTTAGLSAVVDWGDGTTTDYSSITTTPTFSHEWASTGVYSITVTVSDGAGDASQDTWSGMETGGSEYTPYPSTRVLDTRKGIGAPVAPIPAGGTLQLQVGNPSIPEPYGITAVVMNVTATRSTSSGYLSVYGDGDESDPPTSNLNFSTNVNVANLVIVPVDSGGLVDFHNGSPGNVDVVADVQGYFSVTETNKFVNVAPTRLLDTRKGIGTGGVVKQIPGDGDLTLTVAGAGNGAIPATGNTAAVAMNLTAANGSGSGGNITAYPAGQPMPATSNVNYSAGQTIANMAIVPLGSNGQVVFHNNSSTPVDLVADATGYFTSSPVTGANAYVPMTPAVRDLDTRPNALPDDTPTGFWPGWVDWATSMIFNATVTEPTSSGYLSLYPYDPNTPNVVPSTSNVNFTKNETVPNLAIVPLGTVPDTTFDPPVYDIGIYLGGSGSGQVVLDFFGFFANT